MTQTEDKLRIKEGRTELTVKHNGGDLTFIHPAYGFDTYFNVGRQIEQGNLRRPTMAEQVSLAYTAFNSDDRYSEEIKDIMRKRALWGFTGNLYIPKKGAYIENDPKIRGDSIFMDESELIRKLEANDSSVRFVPFGYKVGEMNLLDLAKNEYVKALVEGEEGAEKLAEVASSFKRKPRLIGYEYVNEPLIRVSALDSDWNFGGRLDVGGYRGDGWGGCALGVKKTGEASCAEK